VKCTTNKEITGEIGMKRFKLYTTDGIIETDDYEDKTKYVLHREDGPASIDYNEDGSIQYEGWYINGVKHREDGPAVIHYNDDGSIQYEGRYWCGMRHRHDYTLPTVTFGDGPQYYYWYGVGCKPEELLDKVFRDRIQLEQLG